MIWVCPITKEECSDFGCRRRANLGAFRTTDAAGWKFLGGVRPYSCRRLVKDKIPCGRSTCAHGQRTCAHGHGVILVPSPENGDGWVLPCGRGCCPTCRSYPVGAVYKPGMKAP